RTLTPGSNHANSIPLPSPPPNPRHRNTLTRSSSDGHNHLLEECEKWRLFSADIVPNLQDCVGVEYSPSTGQCHIIGTSENDYQPQSGISQREGGGGSPLITKSCVKVCLRAHSVRRYVRTFSNFRASVYAH